MIDTRALPYIGSLDGLTVEVGDRINQGGAVFEVRSIEEHMDGRILSAACVQNCDGDSMDTEGFRSFVRLSGYTGSFRY